MLLVVCQLSRDVIGGLLLVKLSVLQSFSRSLFCLISSISRLYVAGNCWLLFSGVCSELANQLSSKKLIIVCRIRHTCRRVPVNLMFRL